MIDTPHAPGVLRGPARPDLAVESDLLAAIYAEPANRDLKAVYGDWLAQRGDPRGELIALQLAGLGEVRVAQLIREHGAAWTGALDRWFEREGRRFVDGFFAGGTVATTDLEGVTASLVAEPAWRLVQHLDAGWSHDEMVVAMLAHPALAHVRSAVLAREAYASQVAMHTPLAIAELVVRHRVTLAPGGPFDRFDGLANLVSLHLAHNRGDLVEWARRAPVLERLERLEVSVCTTMAATVDAVAARGGALREVVLLGDDLGAAKLGAGWVVHLARDHAPGPFTALRARHRGASTTSAQWAEALARVLSELDPSAIGSVAIEGDRRTLRAADRSRLEQVLARFAHATIARVAWDRPAAPTGERCELRLSGTSLFSPAALPALWRLVAGELAQGYDGYTIGQGAKTRRLTDDPVGHLLGEELGRVVLARAGTTRRFAIEKAGMNAQTSAELELPPTYGTPELLAWLARLLALGTFDVGEVGPLGMARASRDVLAEFHAISPNAGWLFVFGPSHPMTGVPIDRVVARLADLAGAFVDTLAGHRVIGASASLASATPERVAIVVQRMRELLYGALPYDLRARVVGALGEVATRRGLVLDDREPTSLEVLFASPDRQRQLIVRVEAPFVRPRGCVYFDEPERDDPMLVDWTPLAAAVELDALLAGAIARI